MPADPLVKRSATWMAQAVRDGAVSAVELVDAHAARIEARNPAVNAIVLPRLDEAREEARAADAARSRGEELGSLHGVPFTAKEIIDVAGMPSTSGSLLHDGRPARDDAEVVRRMRRAGAILLGKTNLSELCAFWDSVNPRYGATRNPHDLERSAGGSSGGEAAALAAAMTPLGIGSDLSGSIRAPSHWTGVFGLRGGRDAIPAPAHEPLLAAAGMQLWGTAGPMARSAGDLDLALGAIAERRVEPAAVDRVAVFEDDGLQPVSRACREAVRLAAAALADAGVEVAGELPPSPRELRAAFDTVLNHEILAAVRGFTPEQEEQLAPYLADIVRAGRAFAPSLDDYMAAFGRIAEIEQEATRWFERFPVALCPVAPDVAPPLGAFAMPPVDGEPLRPGGKLTLCSYANALGLPAIAVPALRTDAGLPVGVQLIARRGEERTLIALAARLEESLGGWIDPDG